MGTEKWERRLRRERMHRRNGGTENERRRPELTRPIEDELSSPFNLRCSVSPVNPCPPCPPRPPCPLAFRLHHNGRQQVTVPTQGRNVAIEEHERAHEGTRHRSQRPAPRVARQVEHPQPAGDEQDG